MRKQRVLMPSPADDYMSEISYNAPDLPTPQTQTAAAVTPSFMNEASSQQFTVGG